jgi:predicted chitinase
MDYDLFGNSPQSASIIRDMLLGPEGSPLAPTKSLIPRPRPEGSSVRDIDTQPALDEALANTVGENLKRSTLPEARQRVADAVVPVATNLQQPVSTDWDRMVDVNTFLSTSQAIPTLPSSRNATPPLQMPLTGIDFTAGAQPVEEEEAGVDQEAVAQSFEQQEDMSDNPVNFALEQNADNTTLTRASIENQIRDALGSNMRSAAILGAFSKESGTDFSTLEEGTSYSLGRAYEMWVDEDVNTALNTLPSDVRQRLQTDFDNNVSTGGAASAADRTQLGLAVMDMKYGGGSTYRGRGLIHITHDYNYRAVGDRIGVDLVENPELVNDPRYAVPAALAYLEIAGFFKPNQRITENTLHSMVNPGANADIKADRWANTQAYLRQWRSEAPPSESLVPRPRPNTQE